MSSLLGRYFSERDLRFINSINSEFYNDIVQCVVVVYKVSASDTKTNIYNESDNNEGITYFPGVEVTALYEKDDINSEFDDFGPDRSQNCIFKFREATLKEFELYPEIGDIIEYNNRFYEIDNPVREQLIGGIPDKSWSIICHCHYTRLSKINLVNRQY